jgi:hypothetical protein
MCQPPGSVEGGVGDFASCGTVGGTVDGGSALGGGAEGTDDVASSAGS